MPHKRDEIASLLRRKVTAEQGIEAIVDEIFDILLEPTKEMTGASKLWCGPYGCREVWQKMLRKARGL